MSQKTMGESNYSLYETNYTECVTCDVEMSTNAFIANKSDITKKELNMDTNWLNNVTDPNVLSYRLNYNESSNASTSKDNIIQYAFMIIGCVCLLTALLFMSIFVNGTAGICRRKEHEPEKQHETAQRTTKDSREFRYTLLTILFFFFMSYVVVPAVLGSFIAAFVVEGLGWDKSKGSVITSAMWGSMAVGRLVGIPISAYVTPRKMVYTNTILTTLAAAVLLVSAFTTDVLVWVGVCLINLASATTCPTMLLWAQGYIAVDGKAISVSIVASSVVFMSVTPLVGYLYQTVSHMWVIYFILGSSVLNILILALADIVASKYKAYVEKKNNTEFSGRETTEEHQLLQTTNTSGKIVQVVELQPLAKV